MFMKSGLCFWSALPALLLFHAVASAQNISWKADDARLGLLKRASLLLEGRVGDRQDRTLGKVQDMLLDLSGGRVLVTLVSAGTAGQLTPVPGRCYKYANNARLVIDVEKKAFIYAPRISAQEPFRSLDPASLRDSFVYFNESPPQVSPGGHFCSAGSLIGTPVMSREGETMGQVRDVMLDVPTAQVVYLVVEPEHAAGELPELYVVPPVAAHVEKGGAIVVLSGDRSHFLAGPHFSREFWSDLAFPALARAARRHYGLETDQDKSAPEPKAPEPDDYQITRAILAEITHSAEGLLNTRISITTVRGRVTVAGILKDSNEKRQILSAAHRVVGVENVEDQLETREKPTTAKL
jgi:sporulation protein YlmC with PRC-barrel domain